MSTTGPGLKKCGNMCIAALVSYIDETGKRVHCVFVPSYCSASDKLTIVQCVSSTNTGVKELDFKCEVSKVFPNFGDVLHNIQDTWADVALKRELSPDSF